MNTFSELPSEYARRCGFTNLYFAQVCGIDRMLIQKYISGKHCTAHLQHSIINSEVLSNLIYSMGNAAQ